MRALALLLAAWLLVPEAPAADAPLPPALLTALAQDEPAVQGLGVYVRELGAAEPLVAIGADTPLHPASVIKLVTTFAALDRLGPGHTWSTDVYLGGPLRDGRLDGDLIIAGHGDPWLVEERLWLLVRALQSRGLRDIGGDLVIDNRYFAVPAEDPGAFDGRPERAYNVAPAATLFNFQATAVTLLPTTGGVNVDLRPPLAGVAVDNRLHVLPGPCRETPRPPAVQVDAGQVTVSGDYAASCGEASLNRVLLPAAEHTRAVFQALWEGAGGHFAGGVRSGRAPAGAEPFYRHPSPTLAEVVRPLNKFSNNVMARMLLLTLGAEVGGVPGTLAKGRAAVLASLQANGVPTAGLVLDNGSGLARETRVSALTVGRLLEAAWQHPAMPEFVASLALLGVDGTTRGRLRDDALNGRAHLKTGTVDGVRALAGYVQARSGRRFVLVCLQNRPRLDVLAARNAQDALLRWVYEH